MSSASTSTSSTDGADGRFDVARSLTFFFEDPGWLPKLLVGSLFAFVSPAVIGTVFMLGYAVALARHTMEDKSPPLPEWDDFQTMLTDGLKALAISLAHHIPVVLLAMLVLFALLGGVLIGRDGATSPEELAFVGLPALFGGFIIVFVLSLALIVYVPATFVRFVKTGRLGAAFDVTANIDFIRTQGNDYVLGLLAVLLAGFIAQFGFLLFCIGVFPAAFWSICVFGHVVGQLARLPAHDEAS